MRKMSPLISNQNKRSFRPLFQASVLHIVQSEGRNILIITKQEKGKKYEKNNFNNPKFRTKFIGFC